MEGRENSCHEYQTTSGQRFFTYTEGTTVYVVLLVSQIFGDLPKICYWRHLNLAMEASIVWHDQILYTLAKLIRWALAYAKDSSY